MSNDRINILVLCALSLALIAYAGETFESKGRARFNLFISYSAVVLCVDIVHNFVLCIVVHIMITMLVRM